MKRLTTGTFYDPAAANKAVDDLIAIGYPRDRVHVIMSGDTRRRFGAADAPGERQGANVAKGAAAGGMIGGTLGAIIAGVAATGAVTATIATGGVLAPLFVAGPAAAALAGGGAGAAAGSVVGALVGLGVPHEEAQRIERDVDAGAIVVGVDTTDESRAAVLRALRANGAGSVVETVGAR